MVILSGGRSKQYKKTNLSYNRGDYAHTQISLIKENKHFIERPQT